MSKSTDVIFAVDSIPAILAFVGTKMLISDYYKIPIMASLGVVAVILITSVALSVMRARMLEYRARELKKLHDHGVEK